MLNTENQYRLVFCSNITIQLSALIQALSEQGFIGAAIFSPKAGGSASDNEYCVGDSFLSSITFMGCSPYIEFEPSAELQKNDSADFCFIRVSACKQDNAMYHAEQFEKLKTIPRCEQCRKVISSWADKVKHLNGQWQLDCPHCEAALNATTLDWRKASGVGNIFMQVMNVYLQEAIPTEVFIQQLESITQSKWTYFYTDSDIKINLLDRN